MSSIKIESTHSSPKSARGFSRFLALILPLLLMSCASVEPFKSVPKDQPHAVLTTKNPLGLRGFLSLGRCVSPHIINGHRVPSLHVGDLRIPPGPIALHALDASEPYSYAPLRFQAVAGHRYTLRPVKIEKRDAATISERLPGAIGEQVVATGYRAPHWSKVGTWQP